MQSVPAGLRRTAPFARQATQLSPGSSSSQQRARYPPDPPTVEEIIAVMRAAGDGSDGLRPCGMICGHVARRASDQRNARADGERSGPARGAVLVRSCRGWQAS